MKPILKDLLEPVKNRPYQKIQVVRNGTKILLDSLDELKERDLVEVPFGDFGRE